MGWQGTTVHARLDAGEGVAPLLQVRRGASDIGIARRTRGNVARGRIGVQGPLEIRAPGIVEPRVGEVEGSELLSELRDVLVEHAAQCRDALGLGRPALAARPQDDRDDSDDEHAEDDKGDEGRARRSGGRAAA